jgi:predicted RNase H-like nuclease (RuvC/YqgF family)
VKQLSREQVEGRKEKAARFTETVVGDSERAQEIRDESVEDYAQRRKFEIRNSNPQRRATMAKTVQDYRDEIADLKDQLGDLEDSNEALQGQLDAIADIASPEDEGDQEDGDDQGE